MKLADKGISTANTSSYSQIYNKSLTEDLQHIRLSVITIQSQISKIQTKSDTQLQKDPQISQMTIQQLQDKCNQIKSQIQPKKKKNQKFAGEMQKVIQHLQPDWIVSIIKNKRIDSFNQLFQNIFILFLNGKYSFQDFETKAKQNQGKNLKNMMHKFNPLKSFLDDSLRSFSVYLMSKSFEQLYKQQRTSQKPSSVMPILGWCENLKNILQNRTAIMKKQEELQEMEYNIQINKIYVKQIHLRKKIRNMAVINQSKIILDEVISKINTISSKIETKSNVGFRNKNG